MKSDPSTIISSEGSTISRRRVKPQKNINRKKTQIRVQQALLLSCCCSCLSAPSSVAAAAAFTSLSSSVSSLHSTSYTPRLAVGPLGARDPCSSAASRVVGRPYVLSASRGPGYKHGADFGHGRILSSSSRLFGMTPRDEEDENYNDENEEEEEEIDDIDPSLSDVEDARQRFEEMMSIPNDNISHQDDADDETDVKNEKKKKNKNLDPSAQGTSQSSLVSFLSKQTADHQHIINSQMTPPPPLTTILRERKLAELKLLSSLTDSDEAVHDLWSLWFSERGPAAATLLLRVEELLSSCTSTSPSTPRSGTSQSSSSDEEHNLMDNRRLQQAEQLLLSLIREHGIHWAEPINRLATLMYIQGKYAESKTLCEIVLSVKPWHMGALSGIVLVCASMNDVSGARMWADRRLPPLGPEGTSGGRERRKVWVAHALKDAEESLEQAERSQRSSSTLQKNGEEGEDMDEEEKEFRSFRDRLLQHLEDSDGNSLSDEKESHNNDGKNKDVYFEDDNDAWQ